MSEHPVLWNCGRLNSGPQKLWPQNLWCDHLWKRVFADVVKNLEMRLSWSIWVGPKSNDNCPYKRHRVETHRKKTLCEEGQRLEWCSKRMPSAMRSWKRRERFYPRAFRRNSHANTLIPDLLKNKMLLLQVTKFGVIFLWKLKGTDTGL